MSILITVLIALHVLVCMLMVGVVLMQRPKNEGLGAAFGGGMTENMFGAQTTHVLQKFTVWLGVIFFSLTLLLAIIYAKQGTGETAIQRELLSQPTPVATSAAAPAAPAAPSSAVQVTPEITTSEAASAEPVTSPAIGTTPAAATPAGE